MPAIPAFVASDATDANTTIARYANKAVRDFKLTQESSLAALLELAVVYYAAGHAQNLEHLARFLLLHQGSIPSGIWYAQHVWAIAARAARESSAMPFSAELLRVVHSTGFNQAILERDWIEREHQWAYTPMTLRGEEEWRVAMVYRLAFAIELCGSETLPIADAERELQEHLGHLRALLRIEQERVVKRPAGNVPNPIFSHLFESKPVRGVARSDTNTSDVLDVVPDDKGWVRCPSCNFRFSISNQHAFDGKMHLRCKQKLRIVGSPR